MTKILKTFLVVFAAVLCQTNLARYLRINTVAPDFMIASLVALSELHSSYGGICCGMIMSMLYDSTVGYVAALDLIAYTAIGYFAPVARKVVLTKLPHIPAQKSLILCIICFAATAIRELFDLGYLFLIGAEQSLVSLQRLLICCVITTILLLPVCFLIRLFFRPELNSENKTTVNI